MNLNDWLVLIIALYGAIVSTILGVREIQKEYRKLSIFLVLDEWTFMYSITITNIGHRPMTLVDLYVNLPKKVSEN